MKSQHRHELETNVLSKGLAESIERVKPHTTLIIVGLALLVALYAGLSWWTASQAQRDRQFWEEFQVKLGDSDLEYEQIRRLALSEDYAGTAGQEWASLAWSDRQLLLASHEYLTSRKQAMDRLSDVAGVYNDLALNAVSQEVASRARFGLGRVYEMQNKVEASVRQYSMVAGPLEEMAGKRAAELRSEAGRKAVEWLAEAELPAPPTAGSGRPVGGQPDFSVAAPSASGEDSGPRLDPLRSLDDILGDLAAGEAEEARYDEEETADEGAADQKAATETAEAPEEAADDQTAE